MNTIPKIIHQCWFGGARPENISQWMQTVRDTHPDFQHIIWTEENAHGLGVNYATLFEKFGNWQNVSDILRILAVRKFGGIYMDADIEILKPISPLLNCGAFAVHEDQIHICSAVFGAAVGNPWIEWMASNMQILYEQPCGIRLITNSPKYHLTLYPTYYFYPFSYDDIPIPSSKCKESYGIHHWMAWKPTVLT